MGWVRVFLSHRCSARTPYLGRGQATAAKVAHPPCRDVVNALGRFRAGLPPPIVYISCRQSCGGGQHNNRTQQQECHLGTLRGQLRWQIRHFNNPILLTIRHLYDYRILKRWI